MVKEEPDYQRYEITPVKSAIQVIEFLATGDILAFRSLQEISTATGISKDRAFRILSTLITLHWAEKKEPGFRLSFDGLFKHLVYAQNYYSRLAKQYGVKIKT